MVHTLQQATNHKTRKNHTMKSFAEITTALTAYIDKAEAAVERAQELLAEKVQAGGSAMLLVPALVDLAKREGRLGAARRLEREFKIHGEGGVVEAVMHLATEGVEDTWSGRGNDIPRAMHDGKLETLNFIKAFLF